MNIEELLRRRHVILHQRRGFGGISGVVPPTPSVISTENLVSFWMLDDASTVDSFGTNTLVAPVADPAPTAIAGPTSVITRAAGCLDTGGGFGRWYTAPSNAGMQADASTSLYINCWAYRSEVTTTGTLCGKFSNDNAWPRMEYLFYFNASAGRYQFLTGDGSAGSLLSGSLIPANDVWTFFEGWWNPATGRMYFAQSTVDTFDETPDEQDCDHPPFAGTNNFAFFFGGTKDAFSQWYGGAASCALYIGRIPALVERQAFWNSGLGQVWPFV